jgi:phenylalanine-4-hydroxylase
VIAADIRQINHIEYTPAPDIIHEAAGHAPIIADPDYAEYLRKIGAVGAKAMSSRKDYELYEAIRHLSIIKERPDAGAGEVAQADQDVEYKQKHLGEPSEMARLSRMHWWTVEYGLIGPLDAPRIYGAGLLSSIGESANCLTEQVKKLPYDANTADYAFDITTQQPHLFVTPDFDHLITVLDDFSESMAFNTGGRAGLEKAIECRNLSTFVYSSGLQVSGVVTEYLANDDGQPVLIKTTGPAMLSIGDSMLRGHDKDYYSDGLLTPVGNLKGSNKPVENLTDAELKVHGVLLAQEIALRFVSGIVVSGELRSITRNRNKIVFLTFSSVRIRHDGTLIFDSEGKAFNLPVGEHIVSVFGGAADQDAYEQVSLVPRERTVACEPNEAQQELRELYRKVRDCREQGLAVDLLPPIWKQLQSHHATDWLLALEIAEILTARDIHPELKDEINRCLKSRAVAEPELSNLITKGLALAV